MERVSLSGSWQYIVDSCMRGEQRGYHTENTNRDAWQSIEVPSTFAAIDPVLATYDRAVWYARTVQVPAAWRGMHVVIRFEGVNFHAAVWVNGRLAGRNEDGYLPFEFCVHELLRCGEENLIVVAVDAVHRAGELTGPRHTLQVGWRCDGGILRDVAMVARDFLRVQELQVDAEPAADGGHVRMAALVENERPGPAHASLRVVVRGADGGAMATLASEVHVLKPGTSEEIVLEGGVAGVLPWSPEDPRLYAVDVSCMDGDQAADTVTVRVGFRKIEARNERLLLNGHEIYLTGFNRHEDSPRTGQAVDRELTRRDLEEMKEAGCNFVRLCHYPHDPGEIDMCDELGLLVMCEVPLYNWPGYGEDGGEEAYSKKVDAAERCLTAMIRRDRNHPSVIFWSVSNETAEERTEVVEANDRLLRLARSLDKTRLIVHVSFGVSKRHHFRLDDVICFNEYPTMNDMLSGRAEPDGDFSGATEQYRRILTMLHDAYPGKPILVAEFGCPSLTGQPSGDLGEETAARAIEADFAGMDFPYVCGATVWCWADHPWPIPHRGFFNLDCSPFGVQDRNRTKRPSFYKAVELFGKKQGGR